MEIKLDSWQTITISIVVGIQLGMFYTLLKIQRALEKIEKIHAEKNAKNIDG
jgi:uncharacterized membrane-anchored protein YhcB (DUF1043 family)